MKEQTKEDIKEIVILLIAIAIVIGIIYAFKHASDLSNKLEKECKLLGYETIKLIDNKEICYNYTQAERDTQKVYTKLNGSKNETKNNQRI